MPSLTRRIVTWSLAVLGIAGISGAVLAADRIHLHRLGERRLAAAIAEIKASGDTATAADVWKGTPPIDQAIEDRAWNLLDPMPAHPRQYPSDIEDIPSRCLQLKNEAPSPKITAKDREALAKAHDYIHPWETLLESGHLNLAMCAWQHCPGIERYPPYLRSRSALLEARFAIANWELALASGDSGVMHYLDALDHAFRGPCDFIDAITAAEITTDRNDQYLIELIRGLLPQPQLEQWLKESAEHLVDLFVSAAHTDRILRGYDPTDWELDVIPLTRSWALTPTVIGDVTLALFDFEKNPLDFHLRPDYCTWMSPKAGPVNYATDPLAAFADVYRSFLPNASITLTSALGHHHMTRTAATLVSQWRLGHGLPESWTETPQAGAAGNIQLAYQRLSASRFMLSFPSRFLPPDVQPHQIDVAKKSGASVVLWRNLVAIDCKDVPRTPL